MCLIQWFSQPVIADSSSSMFFDACVGLHSTIPNDMKEMIQSSQSKSHPFNHLRKNTPINYSIMQGTSCLRGLEADQRQLCDILRRRQQETTSSEAGKNDDGKKTMLAILLFLRGNISAAHEVLLGVTLENLDEAEYAATHRGQTSWNEDHPLSIEDDILHSLIHLSEGKEVGEGGYMGLENAKYWAAGGDKKWYNDNDDSLNEKEEASLVCHPVYEALRKLVTQQKLHTCMDLLWPKDTKTHEIIAGGGTYRRVTVPSHCWDPFQFIDLISKPEELAGDMRNELEGIHRGLVLLLLRYTLLQEYSSKTVSTALEDGIIIR